MRTIAVGPGTNVSEQRHEKTVRIVTAGSSLEALCGAGACVLGILALCHVLAPVMTAIATIAAGAALLFEGGAVAARFRDLEREVAPDRAGEAELAGGTTLELIGGAGAVVLGILALLGLYPVLFTCICALALGGALLIGSASTQRLDMLCVGRCRLNEASTYAAHESVVAASGLQEIAGAGSITLGILALLGLYVPVLIPVAMIAIGGAILLSGSAIIGKMASMLGG